MRIPCKINFKKPLSEWILQLEKSPHILDRIAAIQVLKTKKGRRNVELALLKSAKSDGFWGVRKEAIDGFSKLKSKRYAKELMALSENQDNRVKRSIWNALKNYKGNKEVSYFLQNVINSDLKYYSISDAFRALVVVDTLAAGKKVESLLQAESHNDVIRKSAISYFGSVIKNQNYERLKELVAYGGTTWDARPEALNQLSKYVKDKPATLDIIVDLLKDNSRSIRSNAIKVIGKHGKKEHIGFLDEVFAEDPILSRQVRAAKKNILEGKRKSKKIDTDTDYKILNKKIEDIRKIIE